MPELVVSRSDVLIVSTDPVVAALLGASVELAGFSPVFSEGDEALEASLRRRAPAVVLADPRDDQWSEDAARAARAAGARIVLFGRQGERETLEALARATNARAITLPLAHAQLARLLNGAE